MPPNMRHDLQLGDQRPDGVVPFAAARHLDGDRRPGDARFDAERLRTVDDAEGADAEAAFAEREPVEGELERAFVRQEVSLRGRRLVGVEFAHVAVDEVLDAGLLQADVVLARMGGLCEELGGYYIN